MNNEYLKKHCIEKMVKMCLNGRFHQLFLSLLHISGYILQLDPLSSSTLHSNPRNCTFVANYVFVEVS